MVQATRERLAKKEAQRIVGAYNLGDITPAKIDEVVTIASKAHNDKDAKLMVRHQLFAMLDDIGRTNVELNYYRKTGYEVTSNVISTAIKLANNFGYQKASAYLRATFKEQIAKSNIPPEKVVVVKIMAEGAVALGLTEQEIQQEVGRLVMYSNDTVNALNNLRSQIPGSIEHAVYSRQVAQASENWRRTAKKLGIIKIDSAPVFELPKNPGVFDNQIATIHFINDLFSAILYDVYEKNHDSNANYYGDVSAYFSKYFIGKGQNIGRSYLDPEMFRYIQKHYSDDLFTMKSDSKTKKEG